MVLTMKDRQDTQMNWERAMREKAQGSTDAAFWNAAADEMDKRNKTLSEARKIIEDLCGCFGIPLPEATLEKMPNA